MDKQFEIYNQKKDRVINVLNECIANIRDEKLNTVVTDKRNKLQNDRFVVSVFGHFSNGKSTFLNSLMGFDHEVLKEDDIASTATITRLKYAEIDDKNFEKVDVIYKDNSVSRINMDELANFVARNEKVDVERTISEVVLYVNSDFLKNGVEIVDTPGFNSTYEVHSEIALAQVEKSDAAIFLFSCEKPGNSEELEFLKKVSRYMNRVFFVLNKVDLSNDEGATETKSIFDKMNKLGIDTEGKRMYALSSKRAREALHDNNQAKLEASGLPSFMGALSSYLTGQGFVKDRLILPLESVVRSMEIEKETINDQISACSKDKNELNEEIQHRKKAIIEREASLKDKKRYIASTVKKEIKSTKSEVEAISLKVYNAQKERLSNIKSKFDIRLANFDDFDMQAYALYVEEWESSAEHLEDQLLDILDTSIDSEDEYNRVSDKLASAIRAHLQLDKISVENPEFDFSELTKIDEEIEKANAEYNKAYHKVSDLYAKKDDRNNALDEIEKTEKELENLKNKKAKRIEALSNVQKEYGYEWVKDDVIVKRSKIGQFFLGDKHMLVDKKVKYTDDRAWRDAQDEIKKIEDELNSRDTSAAMKVKELKDKMEKEGLKQIDREIALAEQEQQARLEDLINKREEQKREKQELEAQIISVEKISYLNELKQALDDLTKNVKSFLNQSEKNFVSIICICLEDETEAIIRDKNSIEKIVGMNNLSPDEIENKILEFQNDLVKISDCIKTINIAKEGI